MKSLQVKALARKAYSLQKRQYATNIFCIMGCPITMIAIAVILNLVIYNAIQASLTGLDSEYLFCSNTLNQNPLNIPFWTLASNPNSFPTVYLGDNNRSEYPGSTQKSILLANFVFMNGVFSGPYPCSYEFGEAYQSSDIYTQRSTVSKTNLGRDSTMLPQPLTGWIPSILNLTWIDANTYNIFLQFQQYTNVIVAYLPEVSPSDLGSKSKLPDISGPYYDSSMILLALSPNIAFTSPQNRKTGLLGTFPTKYYLATDTGVITPIPFYSILNNTSEFQLDNMIAASLQGVMTSLQQINSGTYASARRRRVSLNRLAASILTNLTHGALYVKKIDNSKKSYAFDYYMGTAKILQTTQAFPSVGQRMLFQQTMLDNAILRNSNITYFGNAQITQGFRVLPQIGKTIVIFQLMAYLGVIIFPFGVSFLLPVFSVILVQEKEMRILIMMKMNGMKEWLYYLSQYVIFFILYAFSAFIFVLAGKVGMLNFFTLTDNSVLFIVFFIWGHVMVLLAFLLSALFKSSRNALIIVFLVVLSSIQVGLAINHMYTQSTLVTRPPTVLFVWPPFAFYRILGAISYASYTPSIPTYKLKHLVPGDEVYDALIFMIASIPIMFVCFLYLNAIAPTEFGIRKPWYFPFQYLMDALEKLLPASTRLSPIGKRKDFFKSADVALKIHIEDLTEDADVRRERDCLNNANESQYPLIMRSVRKVYAGRGGQPPKLAVQDVSMAIEKNITFGLLGPNGAGKTTLISILTGLYPASSGEAIIAGFNLKSESDQVYTKIGVCPQFDILWNDLTVGEHLYFYARLKGITAKVEVEAVQKAMQGVALTKLEDRLAQRLSGGERRRLSIAIALLGDPKVVFLDEPTTGLDPEVRRIIWDIINKARVGKTIVLTTHSMEEAEALCQKIGIMAKGTLRCCAPPTRLKQLYGSGFKVFFNTKDQAVETVSTFVESLFPSDGWKKIDSFSTNVSYEFSGETTDIAQLFKEIEAKKTAIGILDWGLSQTTLDEVFLNLVHEDEANM